MALLVMFLCLNSFSLILPSFIMILFLASIHLGVRFSNRCLFICEKKLQGHILNIQYICGYHREVLEKLLEVEWATNNRVCIFSTNGELFKNKNFTNTYSYLRIATLHPFPHAMLEVKFSVNHIQRNSLKLHLNSSVHCT